jgi:O-antigen/teichoic acid export membrane protein
LEQDQGVSRLRVGISISTSGADSWRKGGVEVLKAAREALGRIPALVIARSATLPFRVASTMTEQALFAGTNFIATALMVRWMSLQEFGAYSFAFSIYLLACAIFESFLAEPITIIGAAKYADEPGEYTLAVLRVFVGAGAVLSALLTIVYFYGDRSIFSGALLGLALSSPFMLLRAFTQQVCNTRGLNGLFVFAGVGYAVLAPLALAVFHWTGFLSPLSCFLSLGLGTAAPCILIIWLRLYPKQRKQVDQRIFQSVVSDHFQYGRWACLSQLVQWLGNNFFVTMGPALIGLDATAGVRAMMNLCMPVGVALAAVLWSFAPRLSRHSYAGDQRRYRQLYALLCVCIAGLLVLYLALVVPFGADAVHLVYHGVFDEMASRPVIAMLAAAPALAAANNLVELHLRVTGRIRYILVSRCLWLIATIGLGSLACWMLGFLGAFLGVAISTATLLLGNVWVAFKTANGIKGREK